MGDQQQQETQAEPTAKRTWRRGQVLRDDRLGDGYVLVVDVDQDAVTVARLPEIYQVGRHVLEDG